METKQRGRRVRAGHETRRKADRWWDRIKSKDPGMAGHVGRTLGSRALADEASQESARQQSLHVERERLRRKAAIDLGERSPEVSTGSEPPADLT